MKTMTAIAVVLFAALAAGCGPAKDQVMRAAFDCAEETASTGPAFEWCIQRKGMTEAMRSCDDCWAAAHHEAWARHVNDLQDENGTRQQPVLTEQMIEQRAEEAHKAQMKVRAAEEKHNKVSAK